MKISFVIPIYNEQDIVNELTRRLLVSIKKDFPKFKYEIIFINDGSTDESYKLLSSLHRKNKNIKVIDFSRNFGHHVAITAGLDLAKGDYIVMMDGDLQDKPEEVIKLYKKLKQGYDVVYAIRKDKKFNLLKKVNSEIFNRTIKFLVHEEIIINSTIFRIMTKQVSENIKDLRESNRYILGIIGWAGFKTASQEVIHGARYAGKTKYSFSKQIDLAMNAAFSFSNYPLRLAIKFGILVIFLSFLLILFALARKLIFGTAFIGWTSILVSILALGGFQIVLLGIIGEYVGRSYIENKKRPLYVIRKKLI
jgi:polyisoprenyl-phosphate glycosyltransferase